MLCTNSPGAQIDESLVRRIPRENECLSGRLKMTPLVSLTAITLKISTPRILRRCESLIATRSLSSPTNGNAVVQVTTELMSWGRQSQRIYTLAERCSCKANVRAPAAFSARTAILLDHLNITSSHQHLLESGRVFKCRC